MPTILELFKSSKENKQIPQNKATTYIADRGQFLIDRENKLGQMAEKMFDPKTETLLEQELSGIRPMAFVNSPTLYGTDIIRITTQKTSDVDQMKKSKNGEQISLGKLGKAFDKVNSFANKTLGIPQNLFPTYVINTERFKNGFTAEKIADIGKIRNDARGTALGRFLKETGAGTPSQLAKQSFGNAINLAKGAIRTALIGDRIIPVTSGSLDNFNQKYDSSEGQSKTGKSYASYSTSMKSWIMPESKQQFDISLVSPIYGLDRTSTVGYPGLFGKPRKFANRDAIYGFGLSSGTAHQKFGEPTQQELIDKFNTPETDKNYSKTDATGSLKTNSILEFLYPENLKTGKWKKDKYSTNTTKKTYHNGNQTVYENQLGSRRGLYSDRDILNQTGRLSESEIKSLKFNTKTLDEVDLIPLRFQRVNDGAAVYFRSLVTGFNEQFSPSWESAKMLGSPFNFYNYTGVERKVSFNLKTYSMSQAELVMMWRRLEFLAHAAYPYQYNNGVVEPTLLYFTFGNIYNKKACYLDSLSYAIEDNENLWEIGGGLLKTKAGDSSGTNFQFNNTFYSTALNGEEKSKENGKGGKISENTLNMARNGVAYSHSTGSIDSPNNQIYDKKLKKSNIKETTNYIFTDTGNYNMDNYKLPKIINASVNLTFIETKATTDFNIYGYGKKIQ